MQKIDLAVWPRAELSRQCSNRTSFHNYSRKCDLNRNVRVFYVLKYNLPPEMASIL